MPKLKTKSVLDANSGSWQEVNDATNLLKEERNLSFYQKKG